MTEYVPPTARDPEIEVSDPGEFNQRRRLKDLADAELHANEALKHAYAGVDIGDAHTERYAFAAVKSFADMLRWSIAQYGDDKYYTRDLGKITVHPPEDVIKLANPTSHDPVEVKDRTGTVKRRITRVWGDETPEPQTTVVKGLFATGEESETVKAFTSLNGGVVKHWTIGVDVRHEGYRDQKFTNRAVVPAPISQAAFNLCRLFLDETDLGVKIESIQDDFI